MNLLGSSPVTGMGPLRLALYLSLSQKAASLRGKRLHRHMLAGIWRMGGSVWLVGLVVLINWVSEVYKQTHLHDFEQFCRIYLFVGLSS